MVHSATHHALLRIDVHANLDEIRRSFTAGWKRVHRLHQRRPQVGGVQVDDVVPFAGRPVP